MKRLSLILFIVAGVFATAVAQRSTKDAGQIVAKEYQVSGRFDGLDVRNAINVNYTVGNLVKVTASGPKSLIDKLIIEVVDEELVCRYLYGTATDNNTVTVTVTGPALYSVEATSAAGVNVLSPLNVSDFEVEASTAAHVSVKNVKAKNIELESSSAASIKIAGSCAVLEAEATSSGSIDATGLTATRGEAEASSAGSIKLSAACKGKIATETSSAGSVSFR